VGPANLPLPNLLRPVSPCQDREHLLLPGVHIQEPRIGCFLIVAAVHSPVFPMMIGNKEGCRLHSVVTTIALQGFTLTLL
jgi:hypothetical protein